MILAPTVFARFLFAILASQIVFDQERNPLPNCFTLRGGQIGLLVLCISGQQKQRNLLAMKVVNHSRTAPLTHTRPRPPKLTHIPRVWNDIALLKRRSLAFRQDPVGIIEKAFASRQPSWAAASHHHYTQPAYVPQLRGSLA